MEGYKQNQASSASSFTTELFGPKDSSPPSPSPRYFDFLSSHSKAHKKEPEVTRMSDDFGTKQGSEAGVDNEEDDNKIQNPNLKWRDVFTCEQQQQQQGICALSSSIHYGGQETYTTPAAAPPAITHHATHSTNLCTGGVDNDGHASRGNWWLGSFHY